MRIYTTPETCISDVSLTCEVADPLCESVEAVIHWDVEACGPCAEAEKCRVEIFDEDGALVAAGEGLSGRAKIENARLWQPMNAYLYDVKITLGEDTYALPYGLRTVEISGTRFLINGRPFYFKGYGKHEDTFPCGRGLNIPMNVKDCSIMRWQGANSFRCSHYPYSEEMMRLADREGFVVIDETTAVGVNFDFGGGVSG